MYTVSVETMLMRVTSLMEAAGVNFSVTEFYCKHGGKYGNTYLLQKPENMTFDDWSRQVIDDAIKTIENQLMEKSK